MKKKSIALLLLMLFLISGCFFPTRMTRVIGSGDLTTQTRRVANFSAIELSGVGTLIIKQGEEESLEIMAEDNIIEYLENKIVGKSLHLSIREFVNIDPQEEIIYKVTVKNLERIETSGLGNIQIAQLNTNDFDLEISGSGNVEINDLQADSFNLDVSGLGNISVAGKVEEQRIELSGAGNYDAAELYSDNAQIEISGAGKAIIWVENDLYVELSGIGELQYYGSPILSTDMSGTGTVKSLGEK